jgi:exopolyphosphatase/guanosine-5'-triphosphate,3'-diphosphate pyrophosphatase
MPQNRIAVIDLGTNTFNLLIAEKGTEGSTILHQEKIAAKMGVGGINGGFITNEAINRVIEALKQFKLILENWQVTHVQAIGTSALRSAKNGLALAEKIYTETGIRVEIVSGDREAELIYLGVRTAVPLGQAKSLIVDIGGGSVEFIIANETTLFWKQSFEVGGQRLLEKFQHHEPILPEEVEKINRYLEAQLTPLFFQLKNHQPEALVGSSGSFDTLSEIHCRKLGIAMPIGPETPLTIDCFETVFDELLSKNRSGRLAMPGMIAMRVDMIVVACCLIRFLLKKHTFRAIRVSAYSLKEGVLASMD